MLSQRESAGSAHHMGLSTCTHYNAGNQSDSWLRGTVPRRELDTGVATTENVKMNDLIYLSKAE